MVVASPTSIARQVQPVRAPDATGSVARDGVRVAWDRYGPADPVDGRPTILLLPTWSIVHSRVWKAQVPYLARHHRVVTFDGRGNGRSDRPRAAAAYAVDAFAADALAVMDATSSGSVVLVALSMGAQWAALLAARHPERVAGIVFIGPSMRLRPPDPHAERGAPFDEALPAYEGWDRYNRHYWRKDYRGFLEFFFAECLPERHSTKPIEDCVDWGLETDAETLLLTEDAKDLGDRDAQVRLAGSIRCPVLVIHGSDDRIIPHAVGEELARLSGGRLLTLEGAGHLPLAREPVRTNLAIRAFVDDLPRGIA